MSDITYRFVASGHQDVEKAFTGIERAAQKHKVAVETATRATRTSARAAGGSGGAAGATRLRVSETEKLARQVAASQDRAAKREVALAERARRHVAGIRDRHFRDEQRREERAASDTIRRADRAAKEAARKEKAARDKADSERAAKRKESLGVLKDLAGGAFLGAVGVGGALIGSAAKDSVRLQEMASRIAISARGAGEKARDPNELRRGFERTAIATPGQSAEGVADAVARFVSLTGDIDTAVKSQGTFATIASASGANIGDVAEAAASLSQQFDVKGIDDMREALAALTFQGKNGAFELKDAASQFQRLAAAGAAFGIPKGVAGVKTLGGLTQIARTGTGSAEQASTAVEAVLGSFKAKQKELAAAGVQVFDKEGKARDIRDLLVESISKVGGGDAGKKQAGLLKIFEREGTRAISPLVNTYNAAYQGTTGTQAEKTAAAVAALREQFTKAIDAPGNFADAEEDAAMAQKDASARIASAWESIKAKTADALLPSIAKLAESLGDKSSMLDPFIEAVGLAAEAVVAFADFIGARTPKTKQQVAKEAERELARYKRENGITAQTAGPMSPEQMALEKKVEDATNDMWGIKPGGKQGSLTMTLDEAVNAYLQANPATATPEAMDQNRDAAKSLLMRKGGANDWFQGTFGGENQAQQDIRHQFAGQAEKTDAQINAHQMQLQLDAVTAAAQKAADALNKVGPQGSIVTGV